MSELNWTALWAFLASFSLILVLARTGVGWDKVVTCSIISFLIFGSLAALTWGV